jgi:hypothetical protein
LLFDPEDGHGMFLKNVAFSKLHRDTTQKTALSIVTTMKTSNLSNIMSVERTATQKYMRLQVHTVLNISAEPAGSIFRVFLPNYLVSHPRRL